MCGICGIVDLKGGSVKKSAVRAMCNSMKHRGPDGEGQEIKGNVGFGHRRLSIIDLSLKGKQPMKTADGRYWITFNGEIYNYKELKKKLPKTTFKSNSDTEVVLQLYAKYKEKCLNFLRGMFAFAIYDFKEKTLFIARDHAGQKPLIYTTYNNQFCFASEIPALLTLDIKKKINPKALQLFLTYNYRHVPDPYTIFEGIQKLPPASYAFIDRKGTITIKQYWKPNFKKQNISLKKKIKEYLQLTKACVNLTQVSDVPVGALLSGGVDSSTIVHFMDKSYQPKTYAVGFNKKDPELARAKIVSKKYKTKHYEHLFSMHDMQSYVHLLHTYGEPLNVMQSVYLNSLCKEIKKDLKVVIGGNGADEIFYGYDGSNNLLVITKLLRILKKIPRWFLTIMKAPFPKKFKFFLSLSKLPIGKIKGQLYRTYGKALRNNLYSNKAKKALEDFDEGNIIEKYTAQCNATSFIERSYYAGLMSENQHSITIIGDLVGMHHSIEIRSPYLDHHMIEFASELPVQYKVPSMTNKEKNKYIMKKSMQGKLSQEILYAKKMGFGYNIDWTEFLKKEFRKKAEHILFKRSLHKEGLFNMEFIRKIFENHVKGKKHNTQLLLGLISFELWYEMFFLGKKPAELAKTI